MTYEETIKVIGVLAMAYPSLQDRDLVALAQVWHRLLGDLDYRLVDAAVQRHVATSKWPPTIAEIREAAITLVPDTSLPDPEEAWAEVLQQIKRTGYYRTPEWSHPIIGRVVDAMWGSWQNCCATLTQETLGVDRAQFLRMYATLTRRAREDALLPAPIRELAGMLAERFHPPGSPTQGLPEGQKVHAEGESA